MHTKIVEFTYRKIIVCSFLHQKAETQNSTPVKIASTLHNNFVIGASLMTQRCFNSIVMHFGGFDQQFFVPRTSARQ